MLVRQPAAMTTFTEERGRTIVMERSQGRCEVCGQQGLGVHHRLKRSAGGTWSPSNLLRLCGGGTTGCHGRIEAEPKLALELALWLPRGGPDPDDTMVLCRPTMWTLAWWQPNSDGTWTWCMEPDELDMLHWRDLFPDV